ncbi:MAG: methionine--tRNA ligase [Desulfofustis sp.]|jgi:methionyl-tRNA synthetase|nr:methionine--tRNA ligase [Desulfofustis sp.]
MTTYITTPIYYVNAQPHLGHAYTTIIADTYSRFKRLCGDEVRFQTGTDEHGDKIVEAAARENVEPRAYADRIAEMFRQAWPLLNVDYDRFIRTTEPDHVRTVRSILQKVYDAGDIYFDSYSGLYCTGCERFLIERELIDGKCPDHQVAPKEITEENYFFRMSKYQQSLIDHIKAHPEFITPERYRNEVLSFLSEPLEDLCISRPTSRLTWGIPLPFDDRFVTYVWFDALINYLTGIGYPDGADYQRWWSGAEHLIAKDILKPHAIYWPTMLLAAGAPLYRKLHVHGYWNIENTKMSKSLGNVIRPGQLVELYGLDTVRYFLLREMVFGLDASFSGEAIIARRNADLANDLGNLFSRSLSMISKYCGGMIPAATVLEETDRALQDRARAMLDDYRRQMDDFAFHRGLQAVWEFVGAANRYIVQNEPWALAKQPERRARLETVLYNLAESLRLLTLVLQPVMPETAEKMQTALGLDGDTPPMRTLTEGGTWGMMPAGTRIGPLASLFPRIDATDEPGEVQTNRSKKKKTEPSPLPAFEADLLDIKRFQEIDVRAARIVAAERIEKSDRLLKLTVLAPEERTVVAGVAGSYRPEELVGLTVVLVANLKPATLMGVTSQGMVLAAKEKDENGVQRFTLATLSTDVAPGSKVA